MATPSSSSSSKRKRDEGGTVNLAKRQCDGGTSKLSLVPSTSQDFASRITDKRLLARIRARALTLNFCLYGRKIVDPSAFLPAPGSRAALLRDLRQAALAVCTLRSVVVGPHHGRSDHCVVCDALSLGNVMVCGPCCVLLARMRDSVAQGCLQVRSPSRITPTSLGHVMEVGCVHDDDGAWCCHVPKWDSTFASGLEVTGLTTLAVFFRCALDEALYQLLWQRVDEATQLPQGCGALIAEYAGYHPSISHTRCWCR